ncbi:hypothetical protein [Nocardioides sp. InS609-2]|uniref:hypothetical protein n=1 Tax=Nocardioides sp. InS609-2 TaxID=2760705 RepID=UPI0020C0660E|nr:hypothetical protein [Nocardioides sp. InS609-2]
MRRVAAVTAVLIAAGLLAPATSAEAKAAKVTWKVTASVNTSKIVAGEGKVVVRGRVKPSAAGQKVVLEQRLEKQKRWAKSGTTRVKKNGSYKVTDNPEEGGVREYRVAKPGTDGRAKGYSKTMEVTVYAWQDLTTSFTGPRTEAIVTLATIGTMDYSSSIVQSTPGTPGYAEFTIGRLCTSLEATYALTDTSETGSTGGVQVVADGATRYSALLGVGTITDPAIDLTNVYRLRFNLDSSLTPKGFAAVGTPRVLCAK